MNTLFIISFILLFVSVIFIFLRIYSIEKKKKKCATHYVSRSYTLGERDENGFCDLYRNGEKTNVRMLTFTPEQVKKLQDIAYKIYRENNCV